MSQAEIARAAQVALAGADDESQRFLGEGIVAQAGAVELVEDELRADGEIAPDLVDRVIGILQGNGQEAIKVERPALFTQAQKARQLGISRFSIRKMVQCGRLHPVELLPGLVRYRADEVVTDFFVIVRSAVLAS